MNAIKKIVAGAWIVGSFLSILGVILFILYHYWVLMVGVVAMAVVAIVLFAAWVGIMAAFDFLDKWSWRQFKRG